MTTKEWAERLNGREYRNELSHQEGAEARHDGVVIIHGASDDLMEIAGAVDDEIGCFEGGSAYFDASGLLVNKCPEDGCPYFREVKKQARKVTAVWDRDGFSWIYETDIPHDTFIIYEDGETYCRGIVFALKDVA
jgi:hypothetical protein